MLSQGSSKLDKLSQSSMGEHPRYKGSHGPQYEESLEEIQRSRVEGNARSRNNQDSRQLMLQEAMIQA